jgi:hypothetical protein
MVQGSRVIRAAESPATLEPYTSPAVMRLIMAPSAVSKLPAVSKLLMKLSGPARKGRSMTW